MQIVLIVILLVLLGLTIKFWFVTLPLLVVGAIVAVVWFWRDRAMLSRLSDVERTHVLAERAAGRAARRERWQAQSAEAKQTKLESRIEQGKRVKVPLTQVAALPVAAGAGLACPRCGGTQFVPRRRTATKVAFGLTSLVARPHYVECVTCGAMFKRG